MYDTYNDAFSVVFGLGATNISYVLCFFLSFRIVQSYVHCSFSRRSTSLCASVYSKSRINQNLFYSIRFYATAAQTRCGCCRVLQASRWTPTRVGWATAAAGICPTTSCRARRAPSSARCCRSASPSRTSAGRRRRVGWRRRRAGRPTRRGTPWRTTNVRWPTSRDRMCAATVRTCAFAFARRNEIVSDSVVCASPWQKLLSVSALRVCLWRNADRQVCDTIEGRGEGVGGAAGGGGGGGGGEGVGGQRRIVCGIG